MNTFLTQLRTSLLRLRAVFTHRKLDREFNQEIQLHLALLEEENIQRGMSQEEANYAALRSFGGVTQVQETNRRQRSLHCLELFFQDLRYAGRMMRRNPGFMLVAVLTLALGIGANTAMFSVVEGVVLAPLPYGHPESLVMLLENNLTMKHVISTSYPDFIDWQRIARSYQQMAVLRPEGFDLTNPGSAEHLDGQGISSGFFSTLGVKLALGREFLPEEDKQGGEAVAVISDRVWRERFGASRKALGQSVTLNGIDYAVVGVLPAGFHFWTNADAYIPVGQGDPISKNRTVHAYLGIARLKAGVTMDQAKAEMTGIQQNLAQVYPSTDRGLGAEVLPLKELIVGDVSGTLFLLLGAVGIVLLIACANVANLLLARSAARKQELGVRVALGASRSRLTRQLLTESVLLSLAGGGIGLVLAVLGLKAVLATMLAGLPRSENIGLNVAGLLFTLGISIAVGILFGLAPALKNWSVVVPSSLSQETRVFGGNHRMQDGLVMGQMALTLILLTSASLLLRTIRHLQEVNPGFEPQHLITFKIGISPSAAKTPESMRAAYQQLVDRIQRVPGIQAADLTTLVPLSPRDNSIPFWLGTQKPASMAEAPRILSFSTGPDYLKTMGIPLLRGRFITPQDTVKSELVMVVDSAFANAYFPDRDPLGQTVSFPTVGPFRIIGVVGHVRHYDLTDARLYSRYEGYTSFYQIPDEWLPTMHVDTTVVVRTPLDAATILPAIKATVYAAGSDQPIYNLHTMQEFVSEVISPQQFPMILLGTFAGLALLLGSVGIYGVISYLVTERTAEIGIRMALGAERRDILRMVVGQGLRLVLPGLAIGMLAALLLGKMLSSFAHLLYRVRASDPLTLAGVSLVLLGTALLACYAPARRASKIDPLTALRHP